MDLRTGGGTPGAMMEPARPGRRINIAHEKRGKKAKPTLQFRSGGHGRGNVMTEGTEELLLGRFQER